MVCFFYIFVIFHAYFFSFWMTITNHFRYSLRINFYFLCSPNDFIWMFAFIGRNMYQLTKWLIESVFKINKIILGCFFFLLVRSYCKKTDKYVISWNSINLIILSFFILTENVAYNILKFIEMNLFWIRSLPSPSV